MRNRICNDNEGMIKNRISWGRRLGGMGGWLVNSSSSASALLPHETLPTLRWANSPWEKGNCRLSSGSIAGREDC